MSDVKHIVTTDLDPGKAIGRARQQDDKGGRRRTRGSVMLWPVSCGPRSSMA